MVVFESNIIDTYFLFRIKHKFMDLVNLQNTLDNISFAVLFLTMLFYWVGVTFPNLNFLPKLGTTGMIIANLAIATLLIARCT